MSCHDEDDDDDDDDDDCQVEPGNSRRPVDWWQFYNRQAGILHTQSSGDNQDQEEDDDDDNGHHHYDGDVDIQHLTLSMNLDALPRLFLTAASIKGC